MLTEYKGEYYGVLLGMEAEGNYRLYKWIPFQGANRVEEDGEVTYERVVSDREMENRMFTATFLLRWKENSLAVNEIIQSEQVRGTELIDLFCSNREIAEKYSFLPYEEDRGVTTAWHRKVSILECSGFKVQKEYLNGFTEVIPCTRVEFLRLYKQLEVDLAATDVRSRAMWEQKSRLDFQITHLSKNIGTERSAGAASTTSQTVVVCTKNGTKRCVSVGGANKALVASIVRAGEIKGRKKSVARAHRGANRAAVKRIT